MAPSLPLLGHGGLVLLVVLGGEVGEEVVHGGGLDVLGVVVVARVHFIGGSVVELLMRNPGSSADDVSVERLAVARGVVLSNKGDVLIGACPFHDGPEPTLTIDPKANTWSCSMCSPTPGSAVTWVMKAEGVSKKHAVGQLRSDYSVSAPKKLGRQKGWVPKRSTTTKLDGPFGADEPNDRLLARVLAYYHETLKNSPEALVYLQGRGVTSAEAVTYFQLGLANRTLAYQLPAKNRKSGADLRARLQKLGVLRESGHEHLNGSVVVPLFDADGRITNLYGRKVTPNPRNRGGPEADLRITNLYGRKVTPNLRSGTELHCWLDPTRRGLVNFGVFAASKTMIVTGSLLDALAVWSNGHPNVTAVHGLDGPAEDLIATVATYKTERILIAFRRSKEGDEAAEKLGKQLGDVCVEVFRVMLPAGMDVCDFVASVPNPQDALRKLIASAEWITGKAPPLPTPLVGGPTPADTSTPATRTASGASEDEVVLVFDDRRWRVRGLGRTSPETMKVNVMVSMNGAAFHVDVVELYSARQRTTFVKMASDELGLDDKTVKRDLGAMCFFAWRKRRTSFSDARANPTARRSR